MYYIMSTDSGQLIEQYNSCPDTVDLRKLAEECKCDLWVIDGQHAGITYEREPQSKPRPRLVFGQPIPDGW